jgi:hypothetical protein
MTYLRITGDQVLKGSADQIGMQLAEKMIIPVALQIARDMGEDGLVLFYTAVATCVMCQIRGALGKEVTQMMSAAALRQALSIKFVDDEAVH